MKKDKLGKLLIFILLSATLGSACGKKETVSCEENQVLGASRENEEETVTQGDEPVFISDIDEVTKPYGLAVADGNLYFTDTGYKAVWEYKDGGLTKIAGGGGVEDVYGVPVSAYNDDTYEKAFFGKVREITPFIDGFVVADSDNNALRMIHNGIVETVNAVMEGTDAVQTYNNPSGLATDTEGNLYVADTGSGKIIRILADGGAATIITGLNSPMGLFIKDDILYIAETGANRILSANLKENSLKTTLIAGNGDEGMMDGKAEEALFSSPKGIFVDDDMTIYVADTINAAIRAIKDGEVKTLIHGNTGDINGYPISPTGIAIFNDKMYVSDNFNGQIYIIDVE